MDIQQAVKTVLSNYATFEGRSGREEFWWWFAAYIGAYAVAFMVGGALGMGQMLAGLLVLAAIIPNIAVGIRRFHDIGKSGWYMLLGLIPLLGLIALIYFYAQPSEGPNRFGEGPQPPVA